MSDPICSRRGCGRSLGLQYDHHEDWAWTGTTTVDSAHRYCDRCHRLKTLGWEPTEPDDHGQVELLPPGHPDHALQRAIRSAVNARKRRKQHA